MLLSHRWVVVQAEVVSQELMNFHNAVDQTQEQEEELIDSHCQLIQVNVNLIIQLLISRSLCQSNTRCVNS